MAVFLPGLLAYTAGVALSVTSMKLENLWVRVHWEEAIPFTVGSVGGDSVTALSGGGLHPSASGTSKAENTACIRCLLCVCFVSQSRCCLRKTLLAHIFPGKVSV